MTDRQAELIELIHKEVKPALGCTEPIAVALAVAKAVDIISENCSHCGDCPLWRQTADFRIAVEVSGNILKNGMGVGIPGTGMVGLPIAAALGAVCGDPGRGLEVLQGVTDSAVARAKELVAAKRVAISVADTDHLLYVKATVSMGEGIRASAEVHPHAYAVIEDDHDKIVETSFADRILMSSESGAAVKDRTTLDYGLTVREIYDFACTADFEDIQFILEDRTLNLALAKEGLDGDYGLRVGKAIRENQLEVFGDDLMSYAMGLTAAASDARMAGCTLPAMSNSGSGNQGITVSMPIIAYALKYGIADEPLARALILGGFHRLRLRHRLPAGRHLRASVRRDQEHDRQHHRDGVRRGQGRLRDEGRLRRLQRHPVRRPRPPRHLHSLHRRHHRGRHRKDRPQPRHHRLRRHAGHGQDDPGHHAVQIGPLRHVHLRI